MDRHLPPPSSAFEVADGRLAVSVGGAAGLIGLSRAAIYPLVMSGEIPSIKVGRRRVIPIAGLRRWLEAMEAAQ